MSFSVSDIINDAFDRSGIYPNASMSGVPEDMASMGLKLLRGLIDGYNVRNMIMFSQSKTVTTVPENGVIEVSSQDVSSGFGTIASIQKVMVKLTEDQASELDFVPYRILTSTRTGRGSTLTGNVRVSLAMATNGKFR